MTLPAHALLIAADLLEGGAVREETRKQVEAAVGAQLRAETTPEARAAIADAYRATGEEPPDWTLP